jgi:hypothetical protein
MNNNRELLEIITRFIELENIDDYYFHRDYDNGSLQLNIEFKNYDISEKIKNEFKIKEIDSCAYWE